MAASTRRAVSGCTAGSSFTTRETVLMLTPASRATSLIVARLAVGPRVPSDNVVIVLGISHVRDTFVNGPEEMTDVLRETYGVSPVRNETGSATILDPLVSH